MKKRVRKVCVVTGSRAEYGYLSQLMRNLKADRDMRLQIVVTGTHLSKAHGFTVREIEKDGFRVDARVPILGGGTATELAKAVKGLGEAFKRLEPDAVVVVGDRYEILGAAQAAVLANIPVAHIAGGDLTEGAFDDSVRHAITKLSHLHFATNESSRGRILQMGENPSNVFNVGSPALDLIRTLALLPREETEKALGFKFLTKNLLVTYHPETIAQNSKQGIAALLTALAELGPDTSLIFTAPNSDPGSDEIRAAIKVFCRQHKNAHFYPSLGQKLYYSVLSHVNVVVGNSSSGFYEVPSFKIPTVNIGDRQKGRLAASSVIESRADKDAILTAIHKSFLMDCSDAINPYGDGQSAGRIHRILKEKLVDSQTLVKKSFCSTDCFAQKVYVIAEAGVNHNGDLNLAKRLIDASKAAGADAVKFQTFKADALVSKNAEKADYQKKSTSVSETQWQMLKKLELDERAHRELLAYAARAGIDFLSTPFDLKSLELLTALGLKRLKIPSGEITNAPLLLAASRTGLPVIVSTGMTDLNDIERALGALAFGYLNRYAKPAGQADFEKAFYSAKGAAVLREKVTLLHCTTEYPAPFEAIHLFAMDTLRARFGLSVGLSDHSVGIAASVAAAARGAQVIEKHLTLDKKLPGPDHRASLSPSEFSELVQMVRQVEVLLGSSEKKPADCEIKNRMVARKSLVAKEDIRKGERFTEKNLTAKRPGSGLSPMQYWDLIGKTAKKSFKRDEAVEVS